MDFSLPLFLPCLGRYRPRCILNAESRLLCALDALPSFYQVVASLCNETTTTPPAIAKKRLLCSLEYPVFLKL